MYLYRIEEDHTPSLVQVLSNPQAKLKSPQHAVFSPDGSKLIVVNWRDGSLNIYLKKENGLFVNTPTATMALPKALHGSKPHGMAVSPSGAYLAIAHGASSLYKDALALYHCEGTSISLISALKQDSVKGTPKGICFSPDGTHLLVCFCEPSSIRIYRLKEEQIDPTPSQIITGQESGLSRPEDIKMTPDGNSCAVSNSSNDTITFYAYDKIKNSIVDSKPFYTLQSPSLSFPHGIDFSFDGQYLGITQFGSLYTTPEGDVVWPPGFPPREGAIHVFHFSFF